MKFLDNLLQESSTFTAVKSGHQLMVLCRMLKGQPFSEGERYLLNKFLKAAFHQKPKHCRASKDIWDVNILLKFFSEMPDNHDIVSLNELAGKTCLLIMLSQMCCFGDVFQLQVSRM